MPTLLPVPEIAIGEGRLNEIARDVDTLVGRDASVLVVLDQALARLGLAERLKGLLAPSGRELAFFDAIAGEPSAATVDAAAEVAVAIDAGLVIAIGGGSALDVGKLAAATAGASHGVDHYGLAANALPARSRPVIAIPTTAGTGSEATTTAVFTASSGKKVWAWGPQLLPDMIVLDAELLASLPRPIIAATGLDALVHAVEAATNANANPYNTQVCLSAIRLIAKTLPEVCAGSNSAQNRECLLVASCWAGVGINNAGTAIAHTIAHALGSLGKVHHGRAAALGLRASLPWNITHNAAAFARVTEAMGGPAEAEALPGLVDRLIRDVDLKVTLADELPGVTAERLAAEMALPENGAMRRSNARPSSEADLLLLAERVLAAS